jgi:hypothetical protein
MDIYAAAFDHVAEAAARRLYGYPKEYLPHACFASTTQYFNIPVEDLPRRQPFSLLNPPRIGTQEVLTLVLKDAHVREKTATDTKFLSALESDLISDQQEVDDPLLS